MPDGTRFEQKNLRRDQVKTLFEGYSDPQRAQAAAVARRQMLEKAQIEVEIKRAGLPAQSFDPGKKVWNEQTKSWSTVPGIEYKTINGGEGEGQRLIAVSYGSDGKVAGEVDVTQHVANVNGFTKAERARADDVTKGINSSLDFEKSQGLGSPELAALSLKANAIGSDLIAANRNSPVNLEAGKIADYAVKLAKEDKSIKVQPLEVKYNGIVYGKADGFIIDGKPVYTNPQQVREIEGKILADKRGAAAPRMAPEKPTNFGGQPVAGNRTPTNLPTDPAVAQSRRRLLDPELATETAKLAELQAMDEAAYRAKYGANAEPREVVIDRTSQSIAALQREIQTLGPAIDQPVADGMSVNGRRVQGPPPIQPAAASPAAAPGATPPRLLRPSRWLPRPRAPASCRPRRWLVLSSRPKNATHKWPTSPSRPTGRRRC